LHRLAIGVQRDILKGGLAVGTVPKLPRRRQIPLTHGEFEKSTVPERSLTCLGAGCRGPILKKRSVRRKLSLDGITDAGSTSEEVADFIGLAED
jgi:hypothetical protein